MSVETPPQYKAQDFKSDQDVRWCPGCGDYSILAMMQRVMPDLETQKHKYAFISGIGCSSRFPYYMDTYGFHTIHGRAPAIATGVKIANPELNVWVISGDGDSLSIGGNHLMHAIRRNVDVKHLLFNNRIYGLTKGQYSPTSEVGKVTKSTPAGSLDFPFNPAALVLGAGATFFARSTDRDTKHLQEILKRANAHKGYAVVEIYQNCNVFNDGAFTSVTDKGTRDDHRVELKQGEPLVFGADLDKGLVLDGLTPKVVALSEVPRERIMVHDESNPFLAGILSRLGPETQTPVPLGVFHAVERSTYNDDLLQQVEMVKQQKGTRSFHDLIHSGETWEIS